MVCHDAQGPDITLVKKKKNTVGRLRNRLVMFGQVYLNLQVYPNLLVYVQEITVDSWFQAGHKLRTPG